MKEVILVINAGSSSIKYKVFDKTTDQVLCSGQCEKIGNPMGIFSIKTDQDKSEVEFPIPNRSSCCYGWKKIRSINCN